MDEKGEGIEREHSADQGVAERRLRILMIITRLDRGGSAEVVLQLSEMAQRLGHDVTLAYGATREPHENLRKFAARSGVKLIEVKDLVREISPVRDVSSFLRLVWLIRNHKPDILHTHTSKAGIIGRTAAAVAKILFGRVAPRIVIHSPHGHIFYGYFSPQLTRAFIWMEKVCAVWTDRVITLTRRGAEDHFREKIAPRWRFVPIPCGIDLSRFHPPTFGERARARKRFGLGESPVVGWLGRLVPIKGCDLFLKACARVASESKDVQFLVAGDGEEKNHLVKLAHDLGLWNRVVFAGTVSPPLDVYHAIDVFVLSSLNEGLGRVIIEAMACGVPVVGTAVGGVPEILENEVTGLLVPPRNEKALAEAICRLLSDQRLAKRLINEGLKARQAYDVRQTTARTIHLYEGLLAEKTKGPIVCLSG